MAGGAWDEERTVATTRKARHDYDILERIEAGIVLTGSEVKSLRGGRASIAEAFARVRGGAVWIEGMHVPEYAQGDTRNHQPLRPRKLLLRRAEIERLRAALEQERLALVPMRVYFTHGLAKVELGLARGRRRHEKRQAIAKREARREAERELGRRR
jgi:SsrA-binding protein